jgi:L-ribulokinase
MSRDKYVIGIDFGTDSVRALVVNAETGKEEAEAEAPYPRWAEGRYCDPANNRFRQHPLDYIESLESVVRGALKKVTPEKRNKIIGIGIDTTGSTPCAVDRQGSPLALKKEFSENPDAMFVLWKDHTAIEEADQINQRARHWGGTDFTAFEGGIYSSEWFWAKILHVLRSSAEVREAAYSWVEHCDWLPALLTGNTDPLALKRSRCAAGHKAMWHWQWGGLPDEQFLEQLDPLLAGLKQKLYKETFTSDNKAGELCAEWAQRLNLEAGIAIAVGALDAHMGAVGGGVTKETLAKIMGTSICDMIVAPPDALQPEPVAGICGQVDGSIVPGMVGLEAGQSAFGDVYAWFADLLSWPLKWLDNSLSPEEARERIFINLTEEAQKMAIENTGLLALDWLNGRRTPDADQNLKGAIIGLTLGSSAPAIFRALVEATAYGSRAIVERLVSSGVEIRQVVAMGGIAHKSPFVMQVSADVMNMPIKVVKSEQTCALGAAMFAAVAAGFHQSLTAAQGKMVGGFSRTYTPIPENVDRYEQLYQSYLKLGETIAGQLRAL